MDSGNLDGFQMKSVANQFKPTSLLHTQNIILETFDNNSLVQFSTLN